MSNRFSKPVAFNRTNEDDAKRLDHLKDKNFSGYVKKLIDAAIKKETEKTGVKEMKRTSGGGFKITF